VTDRWSDPPRGVILVLGGTRSGKSRHALETARRLGGQRVMFLATARTGDPEFDRRIARHRAERPAGWQTIEAAGDLAGAIQASPPGRVLLIDSLALWVANVLDDGGATDAAWPPLERALRSRSAGVVLVSDEVGLAPVALTELGRRFADALGSTNQLAAALADEVRLVVAGLPIILKP
jgi:adenosylcobinamide kinase/adenosylcobinamide-phosphate guanylyltransferase